jgi:hypothetical protein
VRRADRGFVVLQWGAKIPPDDEEDETPPAAKPEEKVDLVVSGGIKGESAVAGKPAILDLPVGRGRVIAFTFDPIHRYQTESDFRLVWNVILNWNDLAQGPGPKAAP